MSADVFMNLLNELWKTDQMQGFHRFYHFLHSLQQYRSTNVGFYLLYDITLILMHLQMQRDV